MDDGWFPLGRPEHAPVGQASVMPCLAPADALVCQENTSCAVCGRLLYVGWLVRPAQDSQEVPYECLVCWWKVRLDRLRVMLP